MDGCGTMAGVRDDGARVTDSSVHAVGSRKPTRRDCELALVGLYTVGVILWCVVDPVGFARLVAEAQRDTAEKMARLGIPAGVKGDGEGCQG